MNYILYNMRKLGITYAINLNKVVAVLVRYNGRIVKPDLSKTKRTMRRGNITRNQHHNDA